MKKTLRFLSAIVAVLTAGPLPAETSLTSRASDVSAFIDAFLTDAMNQKHIPGAVSAVVLDGRIIHAAGYGFSDLERKTPVSARSTLFRICSISKLFISDAAMQLVDEGRLSLEADVSPLLSGFRLKNPFPEPVTMGRLLTHTAGIDDQRVGDLSRTIPPPALGDFLSRHMMPVVREPGSLISYSSYGSALAAYVVEKASGMGFQRRVEEYVFEALGLESTRYSLNATGLAKGYSWTGAGYEALGLEGAMNLYPAAGVVSTAGDMALYMMAHLNDGQMDGRRFLSAESARRMHARQAGFDPILPGMAYGFDERFISGVRAIGHSGYSPDNISCDLCLVPEWGFGVFIAVNQGMNDVPRELTRAVVARFFGRPSSSQPEAREGDADAAPGLCGVYRFMEYAHSTLDKISVFPSGTVMTVRRRADGGLRLDGSDPYSGMDVSCDLSPIGDLRYRKEGGDGYVVFRRTPGGVLLAETGSSAHGTFEKLEWFELPAFQIAIAVFWLGIFLAGSAWGLSTMLIRLIQRARRKPRAPHGRAFFAASALCAMNLGFTAAVPSAFGSCVYGVSLIAHALLILPFISILLSVTTAALLIVDMVKRGPGLWIAGISTVLAAQAVFVWFLGYWNWLGFRY